MKHAKNTFKIIAILSAMLLIGTLPLSQTTQADSPKNILPAGWNPQQTASEVLGKLTKISAPQIKGAHDSSFLIVGDRAYMVCIANDVQPGENPRWPYCYISMSVVNLNDTTQQQFFTAAASEMAFSNDTLPTGACFVPRLLKKDEKTLRCFFTSESPGKRQSQVWYRDFNVEKNSFENTIHRAKLKIARGTFDMQPQYLYDDAVANGFDGAPTDYGIYPFDSFKVFDGKTYTAVNNYPGGQNALAVLNEEMDTFEVLGHLNEAEADVKGKLCEAAINRLPDGTWMAIVRQNGGNSNYTFSTSKDGKDWSVNEFRDWVPNGLNSKPTFDCFNGVYYLGWQENTYIDGVYRSVFNIDVSLDCVNWERKYRFESAETFQYPTLLEHNGTIYLTVTQGNKQRIMFGKLETIAATPEPSTTALLLGSLVTLATLRRVKK